MESIIYYKKYDAITVTKLDKHTMKNRGHWRLHKSNSGWNLLVRWKVGSKTWVPLKNLKKSHPAEVSEFSKARGIDDKTAFDWWMTYTPRKRDITISATKYRIINTTPQNGIVITTNVEHAYKIDKRNHNWFWRDTLENEMHNVRISFEILNNNTSTSVGWKKFTGHLIFNVNMEFSQKTWWVLDGHNTPNPIGSTYAGVMLRYSVWIVFKYAYLNRLDVCASEIQNTNLQAP